MTSVSFCGFFIVKSTGVVRRVDELGRIVIPIEIRKTLGINIKDPVEISMQSNTIILKKHESSCTFCGNGRDLIEYRGKYICKNCKKDMKD